MPEAGSVRHAAGAPPPPPGPQRRTLRNYYKRLSGYAEFMEWLHDEYGDIVSFELPGLRCCAVFEADLIQEVLAARADSFVPWAPGGREPNKLMEYGCLPVHHGAEHRWRSELMRTAFSAARNRAYAAVVAAHAGRLRERLRPGQTVDLRPEAERYTWDALAEVILGRAVDGKHGLHIGRLLKAADFLDLLPLLGQFLKKIGPAPDTAVLDEAIYGAIGRARDPSYDGRDLTAQLVRASDARLGDLSYANDRAIRDEIIAFLCAFTDAPTATICYAFDHLARNPAARERAEREVDEVLAGRPPEPAYLDRLPYVHGVLKETLRREPPAYVMRAKQAVEDCVVGGYLIPGGTLTLVGMRVLHHRVDYWADPGEFRPERWLADAPQDMAPCREHAYIPFGSGPHGCAGSDLATMLCVLALAAVIQHLRLEPTASTPPRRENIGVGIDRLRVVVNPRAKRPGARGISGDARNAPDEGTGS